VIYDPGLTVSLPAAASAASGMNAIALPRRYARGAGRSRSPRRSRRCARCACVAGHRQTAGRSRSPDQALRTRPASLERRDGLHHKIRRPRRHVRPAPHAEAHAALLPHVVRFNARAPGAMSAHRIGVGVAEAVPGLRC
jgi:maleylacetate reductase